MREPEPACWRQRDGSPRFAKGSDLGIPLERGLNLRQLSLFRVFGGVGGDFSPPFPATISDLEIGDGRFPIA